MKLNLETNESLPYLFEIYMQSPFEVPKRLETFFINTTDSEFNIPIKSRIPDLLDLFNIYSNAVRLQIHFPTMIKSDQIQDYNYLIIESGKSMFKS